MIGLLGLQAAMSVLPQGRRLLGLKGLGAFDLIAAGALAIVPFMTIEGAKLLSRDESEQS
jgi:hypothetical protein